MNCITFLVFALACLASAYGNCNCGWVNTGRIVGGTEAGRNKYPLIAALQTPGGFQFCGGTVITHWHVITAAHCTFGEKPHSINVRVGAHNLKTSQGAVYKVAQIVEHEQYNNVTAANDIALLVTATRMLFNQNVGPACLPREKQDLEDERVKALGWGRTSTGGVSSNVLLEVDLKVIRHSVCARYWGSSVNDETNLCTHEVRKDTCQGDSGGPLIWLNPSTNRYTLVALVSFGGECGGPLPGVNTDITAYDYWLDLHIRATKPREAACFES